jgi:hypothetical protein
MRVGVHFKSIKQLRKITKDYESSAANINHQGCTSLMKKVYIYRDCLIDNKLNTKNGLSLLTRKGQVR